MIMQNKFRENKIAKALYVIEHGGKVLAMMVTHVDDLCWACKPEAECHIDAILEAFVVNNSKIQEKEFRFCGKEIKQYDDFSVFVTCFHATEQIGPIRYASLGRSLDANATEGETGQLRSVVGSLGWVARQCRPDLSYSVSSGQGSVCNAKLRDLKDTNAAVEQAKEHSRSGQ